MGIANSIKPQLMKNLYDLMEGKVKMKELPKEVVSKTAEDVILNTMIGFAPFVAVGLAVVMGFYSIYKFVNNKAITSEKKVLLIIELLTKGTVRTTVALGGALVGSSLFTLPVLGSLMGGIMGGFIAAATFGSISKLAANEVIIEGLAFYCLWMFNTHSCWIHSKKLKGTFPMETFEKYCKMISYISYITPIDLERIVREKVDNYHRLVESIFLRVVKEEEQVGHSKEVYKRKVLYNTSIAFSIVAYFYFLYSFKCKQLTEVGKLEEEIYLINVAKFSEVITLEGVSDFLAEYVELIGPEEIYNKIVYVIRQLINQGSIRCLFREVGNKEITAGEEKGAGEYTGHALP